MLRPIANGINLVVRSDEELMSAYQAGDDSAFRPLFDRYAPQLHRLLSRYTLDPADTRDLVQQTFLHMHRARSDFRAGARFRPWLLTIGFNLARDHARRRRRWRQTAVPEQLADDSPSVRSVLERRELSARVQEALAKLPEDQRNAVVLHWFEGLPFVEVAEITGTTVSAVKVRASRAYARLKERLKSVTEPAPET